MQNDVVRQHEMLHMIAGGTNTPTLQFVLSVTVIVAVTIGILVAYARVISCTWCREPFAIYPRAVGDLCRSCAGVFDHQRARAGRRRSVLRRILRAAV